MLPTPLLVFNLVDVVAVVAVEAVDDDVDTVVVVEDDVAAAVVVDVVLGVAAVLVEFTIKLPLIGESSTFPAGIEPLLLPNDRTYF